MSTSEELYVFVYGTLKRGEPNHHWMDEEGNGKAEFVGEGETLERYNSFVQLRSCVLCVLQHV